MYFLTHVFPISRAPFFSLSYFHQKKLPIGTLVEVPIGKNSVFGFVQKSEEIRGVKYSLRRSGPTIKKIKKVHDGIGIPESYLHRLEEIARYFLVTPGALLSQFVSHKAWHRNSKPGLEIAHTENLELHGPLDERIAYYKSLIRETFARNESIVFLFPTVTQLEFFKEKLSPAIEHRIITAHAHSKNIFPKTQTQSSVAYFCTQQFFLNQPHNAHVCVVERAQDFFPRLHQHDARIQTFVTLFSKQHFRKLIFADDIVGVELFDAVRQKKFSEVSSRSFKLPYQVFVEPFEIKTDNRGTHIFSETFLHQLHSTFEKKSRALVVINKLGYAGVVACRDCQSLVRCTHCNHPISLFSDTTSKVFLCRSCGKKSSAETRCSVCSSWRLQSFGVGTEQTTEFLSRIYPNKVFLFDSTHVKTPLAAKKLLSEFGQSDGGILVTTEKILSFPTPELGFVGIVSLDNLLSLPDYSIPERILYLVSRFAGLSNTPAMLQTRFPNESVFKAISKGHYGDFYKTELAGREGLGYPPKTILIKIVTEKNPQLLKNLDQKLARWKPILAEKVLIIKIPKENWPAIDLAAVLANLPREFRVVVEPENLV